MALEDDCMRFPADILIIFSQSEVNTSLVYLLLLIKASLQWGQGLTALQLWAGFKTHL